MEGFEHLPGFESFLGGYVGLLLDEGSPRVIRQPTRPEFPDEVIALFRLVFTDTTLWVTFTREEWEEAENLYVNFLLAVGGAY
jgi:hypothetical protein